MWANARHGLRSTNVWAQAVGPRIVIAQAIPAAGRGLAAALVVVNVLLGLFPLVFVLATSVVVGRVPAAVTAGLDSPEWESLVTAFLLAAAAFVGQQVMSTAQGSLSELAKRRVDGHLREQTMEMTLSSTGVGPMEDSTTLDALSDATRSFDSDWQTPGMACAGLLALIARYLQLVGFVALVGVVLSWPAALALFAATMLFRYGQRGGLRKFSQVWRDVTPILRRGDYLRRVALDGSAAKETKVFGLTDWLANRYADTYNEARAPVWAERRRIYLRPYLGYTAIGLGVAALVLVMLARGAATDQVSLTGLALGLQATLAALLLGEHYPESDVATQFGMRAVTSLAEVESAMAEVESSVATPLSASALAATRGLPSIALRCEGLSFRYPGSERDVLDGLDLELAAGLCTAIVGVNGAGKTTLVKLLTRLHDPTAGTITADGIPIRELDVRAWRRQVSVIFQDFIRYELSAADNIALGAAHAPRDAVTIRRAAERAGIFEVFSGLPLGLDTPLGREYEGGVDLSGGQWQRVAIARSLYALEAGARVLVLDEPTSALDVRAEAAFFDSFVALTRGVTSLLISHRFSSVRRADRIVVVEGGRVVEQGDHDELMHADGTYARLFRLQAERFASGLDAEGNDVEQEETDA
jgi:ATP-binding cassette subfamily B protein